jgi:hypothetical protein
MKENTEMGELEITAEVERYICATRTSLRLQSRTTKNSSIA